MRKLDALPTPLRGIVLILVGLAMLLYAWLDLKNGRGFIRVALLTSLGLFSLALGIALVVLPPRQAVI
jgi:hypothetical protein